MTMFPAQNLLQQQHYNGYYGGCLAGDQHMSRLGNYEFYSYGCVVPDHLEVGHMAEEESRTSSLNEEERDEGWLQLGIGSHVTGGHSHRLDPVQPSPQRGLIELDLFSDKRYDTPLAPVLAHVTDFQSTEPVTNTATTTTTTTPLFLQHPKTSLSFVRPEITWGYGTWNPAPSSSSMPMPYYSRPFQHPHTAVAVPETDAGPSTYLRLVDTPSRPQSGIWFLLQASQNQAKEPFLPQIPKSYLRIKDGKMTVRLLMKYLANKLGLDNESEIEIRCKGEQLQPDLTLQHVRDNIWCSIDAVTLLPDSSTTQHLMILHYGRSA